MAKRLQTVFGMTREEASTAYFGMQNYVALLKAEIKHPSRAHGPAESAMALVDAEPLLQRLGEWLEANKR